MHVQSRSNLNQDPPRARDLDVATICSSLCTCHINSTKEKPRLSGTGNWNRAAMDTSTFSSSLPSFLHGLLSLMVYYSCLAHSTSYTLGVFEIEYTVPELGLSYFRHIEHIHRMSLTADYSSAVIFLGQEPFLWLLEAVAVAKEACTGPRDLDISI